MYAYTGIVFKQVIHSSLLDSDDIKPHYLSGMWSIEDIL